MFFCKHLPENNHKQGHLTYGHNSAHEKQKDHERHDGVAWVIARPCSSHWDNGHLRENTPGCRGREER